MLAALGRAAKRGDVEGIRKWAARGAELDGALKKDGLTAMARAGAAGKLEALEALWTMGCLIDGRCAGEETPLILAAKAGQCEALEWLLSHGASADAVSYDGDTALYFAARESPSCLKALLAVAKDKSGRNEIFGDTALGAAVEAKSLESVRLLLDAGVDVGESQDRGYTPLHLACAEKSSVAVAIIMELVAAGADVEAGNNYGSTPVDVAKRIHGSAFAKRLQGMSGLRAGAQEARRDRLALREAGIGSPGQKKRARPRL